MNRQRKVVITVTYNELGVIVDTKAEELDSSAQPNLQPNCNQLATDTINRQAAIDAMGKAKWAKERLMELPSVQPEPEPDCMLKEFGNCSYHETGCADCEIKANIRNALSTYWKCKRMYADVSDTISRQAAIDALTHEWDGMVTSVFDVIKSLPSAQPEIIRCKDCKYRYLDGMIWNCPFGLSGGEDFFCAYGAIGGGSGT